MALPKSLGNYVEKHWLEKSDYELALCYSRETGYIVFPAQVTGKRFKMGLKRRV